MIRYGQRAPRRRALAGAALAFACTVGPARAQQPAAVEQARDAFDQGTAAYAKGDYVKAAEYFGRADELVPSDEALEAAIGSATRAEDAAQAMRLADRAARTSTPSSGLADATRVARERFRGKTGRVLVRCSAACTLALDGKPLGAGIPAWTLAGSHRVSARFGGRASTAVTVEVQAERLRELTLGPTTEEPAPATQGGSRREGDGRQLSPTWVWVGAGATAVLGGAALVSGLETLRLRDDFTGGGCEARGSDDCDRIASDGRGARLRTNLFAGGAALAAVGTVVLAALFVDWRSPSGRATATASP